MINQIPPDPILGFLAVHELPAVGLVGGLLLVNTMGRPLEFHCTAPVNATKTQQVLYGSTLTEFLYVEVIGRTLVQQTKRGPTAVLIDEQLLVTLADWINFPVVLVGKQNTTQPTAADGLDVGNDEALELPVKNECSPSRWGPIVRLGDSWLRQIHPLANWKSEPTMLTSDISAIPRVRGPLEQLGSQLPLTEPFERIRQAIDEAHGTSVSASAAA